MWVHVNNIKNDINININLFLYYSTDRITLDRFKRTPVYLSTLETRRGNMNRVSNFDTIQTKLVK